ncbi:MAG: hypothetical protein RSG52_00710 [Terrisporobacter sp.]|uniref:hypothetical protein n=1 Tax=Terrisporobacter sp. TaxID=1965305 RepID=UPI002FC699C7
MNIKKSLAQLIILSILFTGCSNTQVEENSVNLPNEATKQQTMTKVQNDNSEIVKKNYDYVLSNLGEPNVTTYWTDIDNIDKITSIEDARESANMDLLYFKNLSNEESENSALYLRLEDDIVKTVQNIDYSKTDMLDDYYDSKMAIDIFRDYDKVNLDEIKNKDFKNFEGVDYSQMVKIVGDNQCMYDAYVFDKDEKCVEIFAIDNSENVLCVFSKGDTITKVDIFDDESVLEIKNIMLEN